MHPVIFIKNNNLTQQKETNEKLNENVVSITNSHFFSVANAGELSISGDAKASYTITSSDGASGKVEQGKGLGVSNEFTLSASGELDNGMSWNYAQDIDGTTHRMTVN